MMFDSNLQETTDDTDPSFWKGVINPALAD